MKFILKNPDKELPNEKQVLTIIETEDKVIGKTTLEEIQAALKNHRAVLKQCQDSVADLEQQEQDALKLF